MLQREITGPLGMHDTVLPGGLSAAYPAGGLRSTARDMLRFGEANLGHPKFDGAAVPPELVAAMKLAQRPRYALPEGGRQQALAWVVEAGDAARGRGPLVHKNGAISTFSSVILLDPGRDMVIFLAANAAGVPTTALAIKLARQIP